MMLKQYAAALLFQSTLPVRGATVTPAPPPLKCEVSIHAPREGSDLMIAQIMFTAIVVSIHAPREGSDTTVP